MPKFSVIIPAHNDASRIQKALDSVRSQSYTDYELIVVCDACTDDTAQVARMYTNNVLEVNYNRDGLSRNAGLDIATGEWILFMDSDDWWLHEFVLEELAGEIALGDFDILAFGFIWKGVGMTRPMRNGNMLWPNVWSKLWKRSFIGYTRFSDVYSISDLGFTQAMLGKNPKLATWDMPFYYYNYMRPGSITERDSRKGDA